MLSFALYYTFPDYLSSLNNSTLGVSKTSVFAQCGYHGLTDTLNERQYALGRVSQ